MDSYLEIIRKAKVLLGITSLSLFLVACGGGGGGDTSLSADTLGDTGPVSDTSQAVNDASKPKSGSSKPKRDGSQTVGAASLSWEPPVKRTDGDYLPIDEIKGYRIYYGTRSGRYRYSINVSDADITSYVIKDLPLNTYYFVLTTIDVEGQESGFSNEAVKVVSS